MAAREVIRSHREPEEGDEAVSSSGGYATRGGERRKRDCRGQDRAEERGTEDKHNRHGVARLALVVDLPDPVREGEHAVACDGEYEPRGGHDGHACVLQKSRGR